MSAAGRSGWLGRPLDACWGLLLSTWMEGKMFELGAGKDAFCCVRVIHLVRQFSWLLHILLHILYMR